MPAGQSVQRRRLRAATFRESLHVDAVPADREVNTKGWRHVEVHCSGAGPSEDPVARAAALVLEAPCGRALSRLMRRQHRPQPGDVEADGGTIRVWGQPFEVNTVGSDRVIILSPTAFVAIAHGEGDAP